MTFREESEQIIQESLAAVLPGAAVAKALAGYQFGKGRIFLAAIGKAAVSMAEAVAEILGDRISAGVICTKYGYGPACSAARQGSFPEPEEAPGSLFKALNIRCFEGGHPVPDENSFRQTEEVLEMTKDLEPDDTVLFLVSGGGSALFEKPLIPGGDLADITNRLLACGADITEINTIRKRLSAVKGGRFAQWCAPAHVFSIVLSDIIGDPLDMIASGPAYPDSSTCADARRIIEKYALRLSPEAMKLMDAETPKSLGNVETVVTGSVRELCSAAAESCEKLGYRPVILTDQLDCEAKEAGSFLASIARSYCENPPAGCGGRLAFIAGGETVVHLSGSGLGGRNQELALSAAEGIAGLSGAALFSFGSDGTDGPTDAAGGYCDGSTKAALESKGISIHEMLRNNDSYHALDACGGLIKTVPTGTNVNDAAILLLHI